MKLKNIVAICTMFEKDNIFVFDNLISDKLCDECISFIDKYAMHDESNFMKTTNVKAKTISGEDCQFIDVKMMMKLDENVHNVLRKLVQCICEKRKVSLTSDSGFNFRKVYGETKLHTDGVHHGSSGVVENNRFRQMAVIIALNGDYDGGEFYFPLQKVTIKLKKGQIIAFPPFWTHPHGVKTPENNTFRYTINTWLCGLG